MILADWPLQPHPHRAAEQRMTPLPSYPASGVSRLKPHHLRKILNILHLETCHALAFCFAYPVCSDSSRVLLCTDNYLD